MFMYKHTFTHAYPYKYTFIYTYTRIHICTYTHTVYFTACAHLICLIIKSQVGHILQESLQSDRQ